MGNPHTDSNLSLGANPGAVRYQLYLLGKDKLFTGNFTAAHMSWKSNR